MPLLFTALKYPSIILAHTHLTLALWIKVKNVTPESVTKNFITGMIKKTRSTKNEKGCHARNIVEIAWPKYSQKIAGK